MWSISDDNKAVNRQGILFLKSWMTGFSMLQCSYID